MASGIILSFREPLSLAKVQRKIPLIGGKFYPDPSG